MYICTYVKQLNERKKSIILKKIVYDNKVTVKMKCIII